MTQGIVVVALVLLGLAMGSFVNAVVWRLRQQSLLSRGSPKSRKKRAFTAQQLSIARGRSMCTYCGHQLAAKDLVPFFSWVWLRGKCRYCGHRIDDWPWVEVLMPTLFAGSYIFWPLAVQGWAVVDFGLWLVAVVVMMALAVYDLRWMLLPNKLVGILAGVAGVRAVVVLLYGPTEALGSGLIGLVGAVLVLGGLFYVLFQISAGRWIGGGDVKLGAVLGMLVLTPLGATMALFAASLLGTIYSVPGMVRGGLGRTSRIPFGPFLIMGTFMVVLFGQAVVDWYIGRLGL